MKNKIILMDKDERGKVHGILTIEQPTVVDIWKIYDIFNQIKAELEGEWTVEDLIKGLKNNGYDYTWEEDNIDILEV